MDAVCIREGEVRDASDGDAALDAAIDAAAPTDAAQPTDSQPDGVLPTDAGEPIDTGRPDATQNDTGTMCTAPIPTEPPAPLRLRSGLLGLGVHQGACAIRPGGILFCWGMNAAGALGLPPSTCPAEGCRHQVTHPNGNAWREVSVGGEHVCAIDDRNELYCWGSNARGQLGVSNHVEGALEHPLTFQVTRVAANTDATCAIKADTRTLYCWGNEVSGQTGVLTDGRCAAAPNMVIPFATRIADHEIDACPPIASDPEVGRWLDVTGGGDTACGMIADGRAFCWGGEVQQGTGKDLPACKPGCRPTTLPGAWTHISENALHHRCGIRPTGELLCWGLNDQGQLGIGEITEDPTPMINPCTPEPMGTPIDAYDHDPGPSVPISGTMPVVHPASASGWAQVAAGLSHTCALDADGAVYCWGNNDAWAIDVGLDRIVLTPHRINFPGDPEIVEVAAGLLAACARTADDDLYCWGEQATRCAGVADCPDVHAIPF